MPEETETGVSFTAKMMAAGRAIETQRPDALLTDPLAAQLAGEEVIEAAIPILEDYEKQGKPFAAVRTRFFDDFLNNCSQNIRQIVLLGSGMDTRNGSDDWAKYWLSSCDEPESFFAAYGWKASAIQPGEEGAAYGRFTYQFPNRNVPDAPHVFFVRAVK